MAKRPTAYSLSLAGVVWGGTICWAIIFLIKTEFYEIVGYEKIGGRGC